MKHHRYRNNAAKRSFIRSARETFSSTPMARVAADAPAVVNLTRNRSYRCGVSVAALSESSTEREDCIQDEQEVISQHQY
jgi:hypothetical protein